MRIETFIQFYDAFMEELTVKFEIAVIAGILKGDEIDKVAGFVKWVRDDLVQDAKSARGRLGDSFLARHCMWEWQKVKDSVVSGLIKHRDSVNSQAKVPSDEAVSNYLAGEASPEEQSQVINSLGNIPEFEKLKQAMKEVFGARSGNGRDAQDEVRVHEA